MFCEMSASCFTLMPRKDKNIFLSLCLFYVVLSLPIYPSNYCSAFHYLLVSDDTKGCSSYFLMERVIAYMASGLKTPLFEETWMLLQL